jgi:hypothetical protein
MVFVILQRRTMDVRDRVAVAERASVADTGRLPNCESESRTREDAAVRIRNS